MEAFDYLLYQIVYTISKWFCKELSILSYFFCRMDKQLHTLFFEFSSCAKLLLLKSMEWWLSKRFAIQFLERRLCVDELQSFS